MLAEEILCGDGEVREVTGFHHIWLRPWLSPGPPGDDDGNDGDDGDDGDDDGDDGDDGDGDDIWWHFLMFVVYTRAPCPTWWW